MSNFIEDASGSGRKAYVGTNNRLLTRAVTESEQINANKEGLSFNINTKNITLSNDSDTPVLYIKNTSDNDLVIEALAFGLKSSTGGSSLDLPEATVIRNPTAGTIVSNETETDINANRNHGDSGNFDGLAFKGATGNTMTDGSELLFIYLGQSGRSFITINEILPKGTSLGVKIKPQASNTSQVLYCAAIVYFAKKEI